MRVYCKKGCQTFIKGEYYNIFTDYYSIFEYNDFMSVKDVEDINATTFRFRLNRSREYVENYIGESEFYFADYFCTVKEMRKLKLEQLLKIKL